MTLFDILRLASERAAETGDDMRPDFHDALALCTFMLSGGNIAVSQNDPLGSSSERYLRSQLMEKLSAASEEQARTLRAVQSAQLTFSAIIAEATGGNGK